MAVTLLLFIVACWLGGLIVYCAIRDLVRLYRDERDINKRKRGEL